MSSFLHLVPPIWDDLITNAEYYSEIILYLCTPGSKEWPQINHVWTLSMSSFRAQPPLMLIFISLAQGLCITAAGDGHRGACEWQEPPAFCGWAVFHNSLIDRCGKGDKTMQSDCRNGGVVREVVGREVHQNTLKYWWFYCGNSGHGDIATLTSPCVLVTLLCFISFYIYSFCTSTYKAMFLPPKEHSGGEYCSQGSYANLLFMVDAYVNKQPIEWDYINTFKRDCCVK